MYFCVLKKKIMKKFNKKAFTLIEMLVVIIIIWVLASALISKFTSVRDRTNDLSRRTDLNQIATAIIARQMDHHWRLPWLTNWSPVDVDNIFEELKNAWLDSIPQDPKPLTRVTWLWANLIEGGSWQYSYMKITKDSIEWAAFILMAKMETPGASNWLYESGMVNTMIGTGTDSSSLIPCKSMSKSTNTGAILNTWGNCYFSSLSQLRFIIVR